MTHPYEDLEDTPTWLAVDQALRRLEENSDVALITSRPHVVGYITQAVASSGMAGLSPDESRGVINVLNEACNGASPIDDWECHSLTGLTKDELRKVLDKLAGKK